MTEEPEWLPFTLEVLDPLTYGAYIFRDSEGVVLYIGQGEIISRLHAHFWNEEEKSMRKDVTHFRIIRCPNKQEAEELERKLLKEHKQKYGDFPKYNRRKKSK